MREGVGNVREQFERQLGRPMSQEEWIKLEADAKARAAGL